MTTIDLGDELGGAEVLQQRVQFGEVVAKRRARATAAAGTGLTGVVVVVDDDGGGAVLRLDVRLLVERLPQQGAM